MVARVADFLIASFATAFVLLPRKSLILNFLGAHLDTWLLNWRLDLSWAEEGRFITLFATALSPTSPSTSNKELWD